MALNKSSICYDKNYSYQHIHGTMLVNFNKLAFELNISHSEYRLMGTLIGLWNKNHGMAFPTVNYLAQYCRMGKATIIKNLNHLVELNLLVVVKSKKKRNNYYFSNLLFNAQNSLPVKPLNGSSCKTAHDHEQIKNKTNKNHTSILLNDDVNLKTTHITEYKALINQLKLWGFTGEKNTIKKYGLKKIQDLIKLVENKNPNNKGAYLRSLLTNPEVITYPKENVLKSSLETTQIEQMLKHQYWRHIPTDKVYKVKPEIGNHFLIRYYSKENMVEILECGLIDLLDRFEIFIKQDYIIV